MIMVTTVLPSRGTDINSDSIQIYGGLHIILSFTPENQRLLEQIFGRTSRQGQKGSGQLILCKENDDCSFNEVLLYEERLLNRFKE